MTDFAARVRGALAAKGLTMRAAARALNYDPAYLCRVLNGKQQPSADMARALDELLEADGALSELASTLTSDDRARLAYSIARPSRLDVKTVVALGDVLAAQRRLDDALPAIAMLPATAAQWESVERLARDARGPHAEALHRVAAEWVQFIGWLHAEARNDPEAVRWLTEAEDRADDLNDGVLAAQAANFKGYLARQQGRPRAIVRWFLTAYHTPGAAPLQRVGDAVQAAHGFAMLGERDDARRLLDKAATLADSVGGDLPPGTAYWLTPTFSRMGIGLARLALGDHADAAANLRTGLSGLPEDQRAAEWAAEYRRALEEAEAAV
ncbi:helix-turn-helix domain-containing protein [Streptomyces sp. NPDC051173]|uniref:helix-turn-helix domain-containing protein n=1 Tax=Streptomyces sp. NPDC051173 TaxID=3155164 RepID=UPI00344EDA1A